MTEAIARYTEPRPLTPPEPPDPIAKGSQRYQTFKEALIDNKENALNQTYEIPQEPMAIEEATDGQEDEITLTEEDKNILYQPRCLSIIIIKIEPLTLIDLGWDYHIVKTSQLQNMHKILHEGPWFVAGNFLSVKIWELNFVPQDSTLTHTAIWSRLPTKYYDKNILQKVAQKLGALLKINTCTSATLKGRYARIYVQVPIEVPAKIEVVIGSHKQKIIYEGEGIMCVDCGRISHTKQVENPHHPLPPRETKQTNAWEIVSIPKKKNATRKKGVGATKGTMGQQQR
ncbi:hypothetical protein R3W88_016818 [Solanum pinnatisectum]|uniref:DUF4283 domain-containing protein n=1 Tax=Solanum pinnatisectum TaxID=50273 RepID=A0AAV9KYE7_9SOLN|nr:hypothetical protein R3W88_016818 [Solanum pinnatisectum]